MKSILLDTNVLSELRKPDETMNTQVLEWSREVDLDSSYLSVITLYEIERGILLLQRKDPQQAANLEKWFQAIKNESFKGRILSIDVSIASNAARLQVPDPRSVPDALIAATALEHNLTLATRNTKDFLATGIQVVNPWEAVSKNLV